MYYAFKGQLRTTHGTPHATTGNHNTYGDLIAFETIKELNQYVDNFYSYNGFESCVKTNKHSAKSRFFGGMTQQQFDEYLRYVNCGMLNNGSN